MSSIRRQINIAAGPRAVWAALTTAEGWESWYADEARVDARVGGRVVLISEDDEGEPMEEVGIFLTLRPTSRLEIQWDARSKAPTRGGRMSFNIARDGNETRVALVYAGGDLLQDDEARAALEKSWRQALSGLRSYLEG
jgi:uncharacterized protein YndB with AHSA1/START domain